MEVGGWLRKNWMRCGGVGLAAALLLSPYPLEAEKAAIAWYQAHASSHVGKIVHCRFQPTCSQYALTALEESGFWAGNARIAGRLALCSPLGIALDAIREWFG